MPAMAEELIRPIDENTAKALEESAKALGKGLDLVGGLGAYLARALGGVPENCNLIGDWLIHKRVRRWADLQAETKRYLDSRGVQEPYEEVSPSIAIPLIEAAIDEDRLELADLWARLLAAAMEPSRKTAVRRSLIDIVKKVEPLEAVIFEICVKETGTDKLSETPLYELISQKRLQYSSDEIEISIRALKQLELLDHPQIASLTPLGRMLARAIVD